MKKIAVVGGGASGMMAAITAAKTGNQVTILEHKERIGKKILMTGNGKCNLTNLSFSDSAYYSENPNFYKQILAQFDSERTLHFFRELGLLLKNKNGLIYPMSEQAATVLDILRKELASKKVEIITEVVVHNINPQKKFEIATSKGNFSFDAVILACGGKACAQTGSDGSGYALAEKLGHHIITPLPALVQLRCAESFFKALAGVRSETKLELYVDGKMEAREYGELQLTEYGISGIAVFQFSRVAARAIYESKKVTVKIDFLPTVEFKDLQEFVTEICHKYQDNSIGEVLMGILNKKIALTMIKQNGLKATEVVSKIPERTMSKILNGIKNFWVTVTAVNPFENAQVCSGGVDCNEVGEKCNSSKVENLYFAGELLDVDGKCGGYNLQWAWASGYVAGKSAGEEKGKHE